MKKILGIVVEFNPLHNGHLYFINEAKKKIQPDVTIAVMSSSFTMRGDLMVMNKFDRTRIMLEHGIDIVLELPFISAVQSSDFFCYNAVNILNNFNITHLAFGAELANIDKLIQLKDLLNNPQFDILIKESLNKGHSYPTSATKAIRKLSNNEELVTNFNLPNNTLAIGYLRALDKINPLIKCEVVQRNYANYFDLHASNERIASANAIREMMRNKQLYTNYLPLSLWDYQFINQDDSLDRLFLILKFIFNNYSLEDISQIFGVNEGIENRINYFLNKANSFDHLVSLIETKRYPKNRIKRTLLHIIIKTPKKYENKFLSYLRILGMNQKGVNHLGSLPKKIKTKIITSYKNIQNNDIIDIELKVTKLYGLITHNDQLYQEEYKVPIIKEKGV